MKENRYLFRNVAVMALLAASIVAVVVIGMVAPTRVKFTGESLGAIEPITPDAPAEDAPRAYLLVTVGGDTYEPIPLQTAGKFTITQGEKVNVVEVTADSIRMAESSCDNQDCVMQGTVSLENMETRALQNMIICLPHEVALQLYTPQDLAVAMQEVNAGE